MTYIQTSIANAGKELIKVVYVYVYIIVFTQCDCTYKSKEYT